LSLASLKRSAKAYLEAADQQKAANEIQATKAAFEEQQELNAELTDRLRLLESMMKNGMGDEPKRRGRPPKSVEE
jgi:hypothetical protein